ncbi:hypothetical protein AA11237_0168 [Acidocella aminolytica 101 = DSM 11237]|nr:hypothetical protein AA11237_0168 [Acidocella aminolytica 101 = DSM 11237]
MVWVLPSTLLRTPSVAVLPGTQTLSGVGGTSFTGGGAATLPGAGAVGLAAGGAEGDTACNCMV